MLGKVKSIALAIMMVGILGVAQAGTPVTTMLDIDGTNNNQPGGIDIQGGTVNITQGNPGDIVTVTTGTGTAPGHILLQGNNSTLNANGRNLQIINNYGNVATIFVRGQNVNNIIGTINASSQVGGAGYNLNVTSTLAATDAAVTVNQFTQSAGRIYDAGTIKSSITTVDPTRLATVQGGAVYEIDGTFAGGVQFLNGATLKATDNTFTIQNGNALTFRNSNLDLRGDRFTNYGDVVFDYGSKIHLGVNASNTINDLNVVGGNVSGAILQGIELDTSFNKYFYNHYHNTLGNPHNNEYYVGQNFVNVLNGSVVGKDVRTIHNVFGDFTFRYDSNIQTGAWLDTYTSRDITNIDSVRTQLSYNWDNRTISNGIASDVSNVAQLMTTSFNPVGLSAAGQFNYAALEAMANGNKYFSWNGGNGIVDKGLISAMNGSNLSGVNYVAQDVARDTSNTMFSRLDAYRAVAVDIASESGFASVADTLNDRYLNRIWAGGLGSWTNAKERKGFEGYKYDGKGIMLGYDRAFGAAIMGIAGAYVEGDYKDKSAVSHDSKIKNYAVNAHMTYNGSTGFFATLSGGWVYSDNDIRENRGGYWAREDYHTNTWHAEAKLGFDIQPCDNWSISPSVGVNFIHAKGSAHDLDLEGVAGATRSYSAAKNHLVEIPVEIQAAYEVSLSDVTRVTFMANGGYAYNLNDHAVRGTSITNGIPGVQASHIVGRKLGHSSWKAGAGVQVRHDQWDLGVKYDYYGRDKYRNHRLMGTIGYSF